MGADALRFHNEALGSAADRDTLGVLRGNFIGQGSLADKFRNSLVGHDVVGSSADDLLKIKRTGLGEFAGIGLVDQTLFAVDDGILAVGGEAHDGHFA